VEDEPLALQTVMERLRVARERQLNALELIDDKLENVDDMLNHLEDGRERISTLSSSNARRIQGPKRVLWDCWGS
jgi:hypothetical protein